MGESLLVDFEAAVNACVLAEGEAGGVLLDFDLEDLVPRTSPELEPMLAFCFFL
jgi:hypothetical protein